MRRSTSWIVLILWLGSVSQGVAQDAPADYPQWRGRDREGSASAFATPKSWPERLTRHWKVEVGEGYATPIVVGDRVYMLARRGGREVLTALDAESAKVIWETGYPAPHKIAAGAAAHGQGPKATPLFHEFFALDVGTGKVLWLGPPREAENTAVAKAGDLLFLLNDDGELVVARSNPARLDVIRRYMVADSATWAQPAISGRRLFIKDVSALALWTLD
jgi:outer membrane protein assembly factor BamB